MNRGILYAIGAYAIWGLFPVYWKMLKHVPPVQLICHRIIWSWLILTLVVLVARQRRQFHAAALRPAVIRVYLMAAILVSVNWLIYIWAVNSGFIIETSLGYFINPLISVVLGVIIFGERLRPWQWLPVALAAAGVLYLTFAYGRLPWIALSLAGTFAAYGLIEKTAPLGSLHGLALETGLLLIPALLYLMYAAQRGEGAFFHTDAQSHVLLIVSGLVTTAPLLLFASAAQRIPLSTMGILQYIAPTIQFVLGAVVYKEPFSEDQLIGFGLVWAALIIFAAGGILARKTGKVAI